VSLDVIKSVNDQVTRFAELIFGSNSISPTKVEYGMFPAKAAALRTLDLSRQVGAAIFSASGEILSLGSNEVPKAGGGTYWSDESYDDRDYMRKIDSNQVRKIEILTEVLKIVRPEADPSQLLHDKRLLDTQLMDALEYGRIVHAEMGALSDAARLGHAVKGGVLYCTAFPCHMCAKHIVASGIDRVVFLEPYPKSLASDLHSDAIEVEGADRGHYQEFPSLRFEHFHGVSPRRYRELFERSKRKNSVDGAFIEYAGGEACPLIDIKYPFYAELEEYVTNTAMLELRKIADDQAIADA
jgi:deoxycytidylate deaminase